MALPYRDDASRGGGENKTAPSTTRVARPVYTTVGGYINIYVCMYVCITHGAYTPCFHGIT